MKTQPILLLGLVVLVLGSCDLFNSLALHGSWELVEESGLTYIWTFNADGTYESKAGYEGDFNTAKGIYRVSGDNIHITFEYGDDEFNYVYPFELVGDELRITAFDETVTFKRK